MTSVVNDSTTSVASGASVADITTKLGLVVLGIFLILAIERELVRAYAGDRISPAVRRLAVGSTPMLMILMAILAARFGDLL